MNLRKLSDQELAMHAYTLVINGVMGGIADGFMRASLSAIADEVKRRIGNTAPTTNTEV